MILYAPYEARFSVVPAFTDFLKASKPRPIQVSDQEYSALPEHMKPVAIIPFMEKIGGNTKVDRNSISARDALIDAIRCYADGKSFLDLAQGREEIMYAVPFEAMSSDGFFTNPFHSALQANPAEISSRMTDRIDVFCETDRAKHVAIRSAWEDIAAITAVYSRAMSEFDSDFARVMVPITRFIYREKSSADIRALSVQAKDLVRGVDYITP